MQYSNHHFDTNTISYISCVLCVLPEMYICSISVSFITTSTLQILKISCKEVRTIPQEVIQLVNAGTKPISLLRKSCLHSQTSVSILLIEVREINSPFFSTTIFPASKIMYFPFHHIMFLVDHFFKIFCPGSDM